MNVCSLLILSIDLEDTQTEQCPRILRKRDRVLNFPLSTSNLMSESMYNFPQGCWPQRDTCRKKSTSELRRLYPNGTSSPKDFS